MKTRRGLRSVILCAFLLIFLFGCSYTTKDWGAWGDWGEWKSEGIREVQTVVVTSRPEVARVYVDGSFKGETPMSLSFPYPVFKSQRMRQQFESYKPGVVEFLLLSRPRESAIGSEREERYRRGSQFYVVEIRKDGYIPVRKSLSVPEASALDFSLKRKPSLSVRPLRIKNNVTLSTLQRLFNALYGRKFGVDPSRFADAEKRFLFPVLAEVFEISSDKYSEYVLEGQITIERDVTEVCFFFSEASGRLLSAKKALVETKNLDNLHQKIEPIVRSIVDAFLNEN